MAEKATIWKYTIHNKSLDSIDLNSNKIINTINAHSYCIASNDLEFKNALKESDILLPDGIGIVFAELFTGSPEEDGLFVKRMGINALVRETIHAS